MVLQTIKKNQAWIQMDWKCSFPMYWPNILYVVNAMLPTFQDPEVLIGDPGSGSIKANPADRPEEKSILNLRGYSTILKGRISIVFHTNKDNVTVNIPMNLNLPSDYESLSKGIGPLMDSVELRMYTAK
jgi:hypothetical protein